MHTRTEKEPQQILAHIFTSITKTSSELKEIKKGTRKKT